MLLARAQQLTQQATQTEANYLSLLEKYDNKTLQLNDLQNAAAITILQAAVHNQQVTAARDGKTAADAQATKAQDAVNQLQQAIDAPPNQYENPLLANYRDMRTAQDVVAAADAAIGIAQVASSAVSVSGFFDSFGAKQVTAGVEVLGYAGRALAQGQSTTCSHRCKRTSCRPVSNHAAKSGGFSKRPRPTTFK